MVNEISVKKKRTCNKLIRNIIANHTIIVKDFKETLHNIVKEKSEDLKNFLQKVNEKLDVVEKLRDDVKIYKTINTILSNHYLSQRKQHENKVENTLTNLEEALFITNNDIYYCKNILEEIRNKIKEQSDLKETDVKTDKDRTEKLKSVTILLKNQIYSDIIAKLDYICLDRAYRHRLEEQQERDAESARLDEILNMCAEYERQISAGTPVTPTEKRTPNKIITNGSLPRTGGMSHPNFIQTSDGYFKFDTSQNRLQNSPLSKSLPIQRNLSNYENIDTQPMSPISPKTPQITIRNPSSYENVGRMDEIGIPTSDNISSPVMIRKINQSQLPKIPINSPIASPYENVFYGKPGAFKPNSPNTQSPRTRIKTTFAHKNISPPQYFVFPTPPPIEDESKILAVFEKNSNTSPDKNNFSELISNDNKNDRNKNEKSSNTSASGIEKQLSLDEEIPMIDDSNIADNLEFRSSTVSPDLKADYLESPKPIDNDHLNSVVLMVHSPEMSHKNIKEIPQEEQRKENEEIETKLNVKKFEDVKKELIADIPELEEFERDLASNKKETILDKLSDDLKQFTPFSAERRQSENSDQVNEVKNKYDNLRESRRKLITEIRELKSKMSEIRIQEDDILRELEMEKALIKGEYDSEIAILNIEQKKKKELTDKAKRVEEDIKVAKQRQEEKQKEFRERVDIATAQVERLEASMSEGIATNEELQNARDILENESKLFEDLEFQHLETESEMLAYREDLQNEIIALTKKIESQKSRILNLKSEANSNLTSALEETKLMQSDYRLLLNKVEHLTSSVQTIEKELKEIAPEANHERAQSPLSSYSTDNPQEEKHFENSTSSSDSDDLTFEAHQKSLNDKFNSIDQMSQSMMVDLGEKRQINDLIDSVTMAKDDSQIISTNNEKDQISPKDKKGFWERNFDSLSRLKGKKKSPPKTDIMSQSLNENMFYNNENIESDYSELHKFGSLKSKKKMKQNGIQTPVKSSSSSKIPTFSALGKIMRKDSFKKNKDEINKENIIDTELKTKSKSSIKYLRSRQTPDIAEDLNESGLETENERSSYADSLEGTIEDLPESSKKENDLKKPLNGHNKILLRKSCGDEPGMLSLSNDFTLGFSESSKVPSQDDIDRISKVRINAPLVSNETDKNSLGRKTLDSLMEIERNRLALLEEQGCSVIEHEREKISELKRRVQNETKRQWESERETKKANEAERDNNVTPSTGAKSDSDRFLNDLSFANDSLIDSTHIRDHSFDGMDAVSSTTFPDNESSGVASSSIEELQSKPMTSVRKRDGTRPLSETSDASNDNSRSSMRVTPYFARTDLQRPLTRYLPIDSEDLDLRHHIESAGHQVELCPHVVIDRTSCRGYLHKLGAKFHAWSKRWFVFDRDSKTLIYYSDKSEKKPRGGAYFQVIEEVYLDHGNTSRSPSPQTTFVVKTRQRRYYLMSPSGEAARIWIDVIFTGAQGYTEYMQ